MAGPSSASCITGMWVEISHNAGTNYFEVPGIKSIQQAYANRNAGSIRHSNSSDVFVTPCGEQARTLTYNGTIYFFDDDPIDWYLQSGDTVRWRVHKGRDAVKTLIIQEFDGKYVVGPKDWDNSTDDNEEFTFTIEDVVPQSEPVYGYQFASLVADGGAPNTGFPYRGAIIP